MFGGYLFGHKSTFYNRHFLNPIVGFSWQAICCFTFKHEAVSISWSRFPLIKTYCGMSTWTKWPKWDNTINASFEIQIFNFFTSFGWLTFRGWGCEANQSMNWIIEKMYSTMNLNSRCEIYMRLIIESYRVSFGTPWYIHQVWEDGTQQNHLQAWVLVRFEQFLNQSFR